MHCFGARVELPKAWPDPPSPMSFSTLRDIEACPRRWGLRNATYSQFENANGYPSLPNVAGLRGSVIHRAIEKVIRRAKSNSGDDFHRRASTVLRDAGGLSEIIRGCVEEVLSWYAENPRADNLCNSVRLSQEFSGQIRVAVQQALQNLSELQFPSIAMSAHKHSSRESSHRVLSQGVHVEVSLNGPEDWFGKADLMVLSNDGVRIEDFKSGKPKENDVLQMLIYAWLWWRDSARNPNATIAGRLTLKYLNECREIPAPTKLELHELENQVLDRTRKIRKEIHAGDFSANVSTDNCSFCPVRQLCEPYWLTVERQEDSKFFDVEVTVVKVMSPRMWRVIIRKGDSEIESEVALVTGSMPGTKEFEGSVVRILDARISTPMEEQSDVGTVLRIGRMSEIHTVIPS